MAETTSADQTWQDAMRPDFETALLALDRAQMALYGYYRKTGDEQIRCLREKFQQASEALIKLVIDELFPDEDEDQAVMAHVSRTAGMSAHGTEAS
jgi:hypothetical protein